MLNQLVRYAPVVATLRRERGSLLEVGSGSVGISQYLRRAVIGLEIRFLEPPGPLLLPVGATAVALPLGDRSVDVVLVMDTLEHIPPALRPVALAEAMRVARSRVLVGGPMSWRAREIDRRLAAFYRARRRPVPDWLEEHLAEDTPEVDDVARPLREAGWEVVVRGNENTALHLNLMRLETYRYAFRALASVREKAPRALQAVARTLRFPPYYSYLVDARRPAAASQDDSSRATSGSQS